MKKINVGVIAYITILAVYGAVMAYIGYEHGKFESMIDNMMKKIKK